MVGDALNIKSLFVEAKAAEEDDDLKDLEAWAS